jgi:hypothetical protein
MTVLSMFKPKTPVRQRTMEDRYRELHDGTGHPIEDIADLLRDMDRRIKELEARSTK